MNYRAIKQRLNMICAEIKQKAVLPEAVIIRKTENGYKARIIRHAVNETQDDLTEWANLSNPAEYKPPEGFKGPIIHLYRGGKPQNDCHK